METLSLELDYSSPTTTSTTTTTTKTIKNMTKHSNGSIAIIETFESNQDEKLDGHPKYHHETTKTIIKNNTTSQLIINDDNKNDNDNNDDNNDYEDVNVVVVDNTKSATINNKHQQDNDTISILATINNNTLMSPSMTTSTNIRKKENTNKNFTIMIDDLFIRKLLHQICPQIFDENWLERFTQQYLQSFHEKKCTLRVREILDLTLSSNSMTAVDEIFVYWPIHHQSTNNIDDENDNDQEIYIDSSSTWLQYRDAMTYLYNFCELLMSIEAKFVHAKQKDMCQQLAREIRSYLYWITNDDRFKVCGSNDNEEESPPLFQSSPVDLIGGNIDNHPKPQRKQEEMSSNVISHNYNDSYNNCQQQHKLFHSILQHLLRILYEILMKLNQSDDHVNSISNQNNDMVVNNSLKFFQIFNKLFERFESSSTDHTSLYNQWMRQLNSLLMMLMKYGANYQIQNNNDSDIDNSNVLTYINDGHNCNRQSTSSQQSSPLAPNRYMETITSKLSSNNDYNKAALLNMESNNNINHANDVDVNSDEDDDECSAIASAIANIPPSNDMITTNNDHLTAASIKYFENQSLSSNRFQSFKSPIPTLTKLTEFELSDATISPETTIDPSSFQQQQLQTLNNYPNQSSDCPIKMAIINNDSGSQANSNRNTHIERNTNSSAASVSSGPSSGVGSLCDSYPRSVGINGSSGLGLIEQNSNILIHNNLSPASQESSLSPSKFLPAGSVLSSSASMTPSPADFAPVSTGNNGSTTNENALSMLLQLNKCQLINDLVDGLPKLITPPPSAPQHQRQFPNNNNIVNQSKDSPTSNVSNQFGFDFNSLNSTNHNAINRNPQRQPQQPMSDESSNFGFNDSDSSNIQNASSSNVGNNNFFNDFNINSLFSSFDDNVSAVESGAFITNHFTSQPQIQTTNQQSTSILKQYPDNDPNIQLQNQCFTMTMLEGNESQQHPQPQQQQQHRNQAAKFPITQSTANKQLSMMSKYMSTASTMPQQHHTLTTPPNLIAGQHQTSPNIHSTIDQSQQQEEQFCERQTLYRLIISQLLFDGHRNIACHISNAEHIKCDSFLIGPSQELHKLVTFAKAKKKEDILIDKPIQMTLSNANNAGFSVAGRATTNSATSPFYDMIDSNCTSAQNSSLAGRASLPQQASHALRMDDCNQYVKNIFDDTSNTLTGIGSSNPMFSARNESVGLASSSSIVTPQTSQSQSILDSYADLNSSTTDLYSPSSGTIDYFSANRSPEVSGMNAAASMFGKSSDLQQRQLVLSNSRGAGSVSAAATGSNELVLTEACLKNLNQLAKLNSGPNSTAAINHPSLMFGRSASAMATMSSLGNGNGSASASASNSNNGLSRSPLTIKSPTGHSSASHTTGQGKSHQIMQIVHKFGSLGQLKSQFSSPHGFCLGMNDEIIIADTNNHRICVYDKNGVCKQMFGNPGKDEGQLWYPRKIAMIPPNFVRSNANSPYYVICDRGMERSRMQIFTRTGNFVRKIPIRYIDIVAGIAINNRGHIVVVDSVSPTIYVITIDNGTLIEWRDCGNYMCEPSDVAIYDEDYYICDFKGHCVVVINTNGDFIRKIGMEGLTSFPNGIDISPAGDIFVGDSHGNKFHVVVFNRDGRLLAEYECPYCKVSRCCGLKLTKDNNIVTLAKNNHHVLVLNPNFQQQLQSQPTQLQQQQSV